MFSHFPEKSPSSCGKKAHHLEDSTPPQTALCLAETQDVFQTLAFNLKGARPTFSQGSILEAQFSDSFQGNPQDTKL